MGAALTYAMQFLSFLPTLIEAGKSVAEVATLIRSENDILDRMVQENREPIQAEWDALNARIDALRKELHA